MDVVVVGAGTSGCYAAATIANAGYDVTIVERKPEEEAGHIACGDALKGADAFPEAIPKSKIEPAFTNTEVDHGRFEIPQEDTVLDIPVPGELAVIDRWEYGRLIIEGAEEAGADLHYDTVVQDVKQDDDGRVTGMKASGTGCSGGTPRRRSGRCRARRTAAGQDRPRSRHLRHERLLPALLVGVPRGRRGPRARRVVGRARVQTRRGRRGLRLVLPADRDRNQRRSRLPDDRGADELVDDLKKRPPGAPRVRGRGGHRQARRRTPDAPAVRFRAAPGYMAVGDAAGHVNPTTGGGIAGAAYAGNYAASRLSRFDAGGLTTELLWRYNQRVMDHFGGRYASLDVYNILSTAVDVDDLMGLIASSPAKTRRGAVRRFDQQRASASSVTDSVKKPARPSISTATSSRRKRPPTGCWSITNPTPATVAASRPGNVNVIRLWTISTRSPAQSRSTESVARCVFG